jgi:hypothetical protein
LVRKSPFGGQGAECLAARAYKNIKTEKEPNAPRDGGDLIRIEGIMIVRYLRTNVKLGDTAGWPD